MHDFNSHAHVERDYSGFATGTNYQDFNSHAHVERDFTDVIVNICRFISTHTLTWSVTIRKKYPMQPFTNFNSHAHVERDDVLLDFSNSVPISTHTLTWSVTIVNF